MHHFLPRDHAILIRGHSAQDGGQVAAHAGGDGWVGVVAFGDVVAEGGDVGDDAVAIKSADAAVGVQLGRLDGDVAEVMRVGGALQSINPAHDVVVAVAGLVGIEAHHQVIREVIDDGEVVPAGAGGGALATAGAVGAQRGGVEHPAGDVERVNVLLGDDIAREQAIDAPGAQAGFGVLRVLAQELVHAGPRLTGLVIGLDGDELPELAVMHSLHRVLVELVGARLEIHLETELLRGGLLAALGDGLAAGDIDRNRLGEIDMLARVDSGGGLFGMEVRGALNDYRVELLLQQLAVAGEPGVAVGGGHVELRPRLIRVVLEVIRDGHNVVASVLLEQVGDPFAAVAAADEADINLRVRLGATHEFRLQDGECQDGCPGPGDEASARDGCGVGLAMLILRCSHFRSSS